MVRKPGPVNQK